MAFDHGKETKDAVDGFRKQEMRAFKESYNLVARNVNKIAKKHGFWDDKQPNIPEKLALLHSEISEALEALRHDNPPDTHCPKFGNVEVELADAVIRIMDLGVHLGLDVAGAIEAKSKHNESRPYRHGKAF